MRSNKPQASPAHLIAPFRHDANPDAILAEITRAGSIMQDRLSFQGLTPLWSHWIATAAGPAAIPPTFAETVRQARRAEAARYLLQRHAANRVCERMATCGIKAALFKGAAIRERLYPDPSLRPVDDLDLLVDPERRDDAIHALTGAGYRFAPMQATISHEAVLFDRQVPIDLHWSLFRPGRSRFELAPHLLETARPQGNLSVLSDDANLVVMLVHPAFAKYVNGRAAKLIRVVDLDRMLRIIEPNWNWILPLIDAAGLRTAAWAVLYWTRSLMDTPVDPVVLRHLAPGKLQRRYLAHWIDHQWPARLGGIPGLVQGAFTLALHDRAGDALHAVVQLARARLESGNTLKHLRRVSQAPAQPGSQ